MVTKVIDSKGVGFGNSEIVTFVGRSELSISRPFSCMSSGGKDCLGMLGEEFTNKCIVRPGEQVKLDDITTTTLGILGRPKEEVLPIFQGLRSKVANQQRVLYAEGKKRLLIVMQAMDTGGKDGCVRKLFSRVDPQGSG